MKTLQYSASTSVLACAWMILPEVTLACERCFGAGLDSPIVTAIGISMLVLLAMICVVFTGIISFFNQANNRSRSIAKDARESSDASTA
ncbi:MAG: hypothetical protein O7C39_01175 [Bacteroidetes bacterium]|nr:hypothetical protein [Bacteroidota bacterium]